MKIFIPARHGLGDVIDGYFLNKNNNALLAKLCKAHTLGLVSEIMICYEHFMNPAIGELFTRLPIPITPRPTNTLGQWAKEADHNNNFPDVMDGFINLLTNTPEEIKNIQENNISIPTDKPNVELPENYVLFNAYAGEPERFLKDKRILELIKNQFRLPIISVGKTLSRNNNFESPLKGDIALENKLTITEVLWLMKHSKLVVSSLSYMRCAATLFDKPVIELVERPNSCVLNRTLDEYRSKRYGINDNSFWYELPKEFSYFIAIMGRINENRFR